MTLFWQELVATCHCPPAFSQSAFVFCCDRSEGLPVEGLAEGEVEDDPLPELEVSGLVDVPGLLGAPLGRLMPELPGAPEDPPPEV